ncbi:MAG: WG repeat-containing protein [Clostridia bacterium]|nr:WG repeat-containing protein [Clostridia bacterium]
MRRTVLLILTLLMLSQHALAEPDFLKAYADHEPVDDWYLVCTTQRKGRKSDMRVPETEWALVDADGSILQSGLHWIESWGTLAPFDGFNEGEALAPIHFEKKWGYIDRSGRLAVAPIYDRADHFYGPGCAEVTLTDASTGIQRTGLIDETGHYIVEPVYDRVGFTGDVGYVVLDDRYGMIDKTGRLLTDIAYDELWMGDAPPNRALKKGMYGFLSGDGTELAGFEHPYFGDAEDFDENGLAAVQDAGTGLWGMIDTSCSFVVEPSFKSIARFIDGLSAVELDGRYGFIDTNGDVVIEPRFDLVGFFSEGYCGILSGDLWGFIDTTGDVVIEPRFIAVNGFSNGLASVRDPETDKWGYIDAAGAYVVAPQFDYAYDFDRHGYAEVGIQDRSRGVIDRTGKWLLKLEFDEGDIAISEDDGVVTVTDWDDEGETHTDYYDLSSGEAKPARSLTASVDLKDYMPFMGSKVAKLKGAPTLDHRVSKDHDLPHLDGATALFPVYSAFVEALYPSKTRYEEWNGRNDPLITCTKTNVAYERLIDGEADIIFVAQPSEAELQMVDDRGDAFDMLPFGREAFVFIVNRQNPIDGITLDELRWIYAGVTTDWGEVGAEGLGEIIAYQRPENSGSQTALEALMDGMPLMDAPQERIADGMGDILETVEYRNLPNALGYTFRFFCTEMMKSEVKLLAIDGVEPTVENIRNGSYPLTSTLYAIRLRSNTENPNVNALWEWLRGEQAAQLIEKSGYVAGGPET